MQEIVQKLINIKKTISTMESCTGGYLVNEITNIENASQVIKFSAVTYSNEYKIKMGVSEKIIDEYSVYSLEVAKEMSKQISLYANSNYGIGITGKINKQDLNNMCSPDNLVFVSIYDRDNNKFYSFTVQTDKENRIQNKKLITNIITNTLTNIIN